MGIRKYYPRVAAAAALLMLAGVLSACQTSQAMRRSFPPEKRISLQTGGPHQGTTETMSVLIGYHYRLDGDQTGNRLMKIGGGLKRFKIKVSSVSLNLHFLDAQGDTIQHHLLLAISNRQARATFIRASRTFATEMTVPPETVYFAFHTRSQRSRGKK